MFWISLISQILSNVIVVSRSGIGISNQDIIETMAELSIVTETLFLDSINSFDWLTHMSWCIIDSGAWITLFKLSPIVHHETQEERQ